MLGHVFRPAPAARRAYSVFSKAGGGRYFNSAKPPKVAPPTKSKVDASSSANPGSEPAQSGAAKDEASPSGPSLHAEGPSFMATPISTPAPFIGGHDLPIHPRIGPFDLKLHQFFSLHRPLLLMSQPASSLFESSSTPFVPPPVPAPQAAGLGSAEENPEPSPEADADAARQLARALVVNRVGASLAWEATLRKLGLDDAVGRAEEVSVAKAEYEAQMDSVKRKRRRKMKKHKLRKRRRLTRAQRANSGGGK